MSKFPAHHVSFPVTDLAESRAFYEGVLGLEPIPRPSFPMEGIWYDAGTVQVHLMVTAEGMDVGRPPAVVNPAAPHVGFAIEDYEATLAKVREHDLALFETSPENGQMWVADPDGHVIELIVADTVGSRVAQEHGLD